MTDEELMDEYKAKLCGLKKSEDLIVSRLLELWDFDKTTPRDVIEESGRRIERLSECVNYLGLGEIFQMLYSLTKTS